MQAEKSILDKVLDSKEEKALDEFNPLELIATFLKELSAKEADVIRRRFGLTSKNTETLESIGGSYSVTRERIRQIESAAIKKIKELKNFEAVIKSEKEVIDHMFRRSGHIISQEMMLNKLTELTDASRQARMAIIFILSQLLADKYEKVTEDEEVHDCWKEKGANWDFWRETVEETIKILEKNAKPIELTPFMDQLTKTEFYKNFEDKLNEEVVAAYIGVSKKIAKNPFAEYGLSSWGTVMPKRMHDRIYLVLKKEGKPMHFVDIAKRITEVFKKNAYPPTVHNELILNEEYILVGRGIYALEEWGYKPGIVSDVLADILREKGQALIRDELVTAVLKQRVVKKNTIHLALTDKNIFKKLPGGKYDLVEREEKVEE